MNRSLLRPTRPSLLLAALLLGACAPAAPTATAPGAAGAAVDRAAVASAAATITAADMQRHIAALAADSMRGRDTPSPELEKAARYIEAAYRAAGLEPGGDDGTFVQRWPFGDVRMDPQGTSVRVRGRPAAPRWATDFFLVPGQAANVEGPAFYAGRAGDPVSLPAAARGAVVIFDLPGATLGAEWQAALTAALGPALQAGAGAVGFVLDAGFGAEQVGQLAPSVAGQQAPVPVFGVTRASAAALFGGRGDQWTTTRAPAAIPGAVVEIAAARTRAEHMVPNVAGILRGSDPTLRDTYVVLTAHFDHVGVGAPDARGDSIFNGADDNASGTSALLTVARAFAALPQRPARSIMFLAVSGEEKGLLGSMHFARNPTIPGEAMIANLNMDMISRNAPDTLIAIGQEYSTFEEILNQVLAEHPEVGLTVIRDPYPEERLFFRSDQLSFIQRGIPSLFFFTGLHEDYHRPSDTPERADAEKAARVARLAFLVTHRVANSPQVPEWTEEGRRQVEQILRGGGME